MLSHTVKLMLAGASGLLIVGAGATSWAASASAAPPTPTAGPRGHRHPGPRARRMVPGLGGVIQSVSGNTVVIQVHRPRQSVSTRTVNLASTAIRAGFYPASAAILRSGERVSLVDGKSSHPVLIVWPVARGTLRQQGTGWVAATSRHTWTLANAHPVLLGTTTLSAGQSVQIFGTVSGTTLTDVAVAAPPHRWAAEVSAIANGTLTLRTADHGTLTASISALPGPWASRLTVGRRVAAVVSPVDNTVLAVLPRSRMHGSRHRAAGRFEGVAGDVMTLANPMGTQAIRLTGMTVHVAWKSHASAALSQIPHGTRVLVTDNPQTRQLWVRVMPTS